MQRSEWPSKITELLNITPTDTELLYFIPTDSEVYRRKNIDPREPIVNRRINILNKSSQGRVLCYQRLIEMVNSLLFLQEYYTMVVINNQSHWTVTNTRTEDKKSASTLLLCEQTWVHASNTSITIIQIAWYHPLLHTQIPNRNDTV